MLDVHAVPTTPGAATVLGSAGTTPATNDGAQVAGVPIQPSAVLKMWGYESITADTIGAVKLQSQDMVDPINGITMVPGAASLIVQFYDYTMLPYKSGARYITAGTNTGVTAGTAFTIDEYSGRGQVVQVKRSAGNDVCTGATTFGGALTTNVWGSQAYTPTTALPNGKYAILGAYVSAITNVALIRFSHADFQGLRPGFPVCNYELSLAATAQVAMKDSLVLDQVGEQFIYLGEVLGTPQCPVFTVSNAGTGLNIECVSAQADTPVVNLVLVKVG